MQSTSHTHHFHFTGAAGVWPAALSREEEQAADVCRAAPPRRQMFGGFWRQIRPHAAEGAPLQVTEWIVVLSDLSYWY